MGNDLKARLARERSYWIADHGDFQDGVRAVLTARAAGLRAKVWAKHVHDLTDIQITAVEAGVFDAKTNLLIVAPTSSGKTPVGEMAAASSSHRTR